MTRSPYDIVVSAGRRAECLQLLAAWDQPDPWHDVALQRLTAQLLPLITDLTQPRILDVRGSEAAAQLLRLALGANQ